MIASGIVWTRDMRSFGRLVTDSEVLWVLQACCMRHSRFYQVDAEDHDSDGNILA